jgi:hypothetical protein
MSNALTSFPEEDFGATLGHVEAHIATPEQEGEA